jgi:hypothetical protein
MAVIINELEVILEAPTAAPQPGGHVAVLEKPALNPQDLLTILDREQRNELRLRAH